MCSGEHCKACGASGNCKHTNAERHLRFGAGSTEIQPVGEPVADLLTSASRVPTKPSPPLLTGNVTLHFSQGDDIAEFLELMAKIIRTHKRITVTAE
jgi:hypothetical protein